VAGLLRLAEIPAENSAGDRDALAILATQASIALQNSRLHENALAQASRDGLTGLSNHRTFQTRLQEEIARAERGGHELTVMMVDLDDFKAVNNTYGHQTGDATLEGVAGVVADAVRLSDVPARYGGDEFAVILPETGIVMGLEIAERVSAAIAGLRLVHGDVTIRIRASIGVASYPLHATEREALVRAADQAAYAAKHTGKGRVCRPEDALLGLENDPILLARRLEHANMATVEALAAAVDAKDPYTRGHAQRVSAYAAALASALDLSPTDVARVRLAGLLHDVGKIGVPDAILTKPGNLTAEEKGMIEQHPVIGARMLSQVPFLHDILLAVRHHHERWDGHGYPDRLAGEDIPFDATILMVADSFDAMTSSRTYRLALPLAEACRRVREGRGRQFHPLVVQAFEQAIADGTLAVLSAEPALTVERPAVPAPALVTSRSLLAGW
jgi:diguanylate cyclase (GGDEF)-like protein/putative nucleotidyltransferase with HDIG domain